MLRDEAQSPAHVLLNENQVCRHVGCSWRLGPVEFQGLGVGPLAHLVEFEISLLVSSAVRAQFSYAAAYPVLTLPSRSCFFLFFFLFVFNIFAGPVS